MLGVLMHLEDKADNAARVQVLIAEYKDANRSNPSATWDY